MSFTQYLYFNNEPLPMPDSYDVSMEDVEAESSGETEAGTKQRDLVRMGVYQIAVAFSVTATWLKKLTAYKQMSKIQVRFFNPETLEMKQTEMYIEGYSVKLHKDTSYKGLWTVFFTLREF